MSIQKLLQVAVNSSVCRAVISGFNQRKYHYSYLKTAALLIAVVFILLPSSPSQTFAKDPAVKTNSVLAALDLTGTYKSNYGKVVMVQNKNMVHGKLAYQNGVKGTFTGLVRGGKLLLVWENPKDYGTARLNIMNMGKSLIGTFTDQNGKSGQWKLGKAN